MQPRLPIFRICALGTPLAISCLALVQLSAGQSAAFRAPDPHFAAPRFYLRGGNGPAVPPPVDSAGGLDPLGLPDLPFPHLLLDFALTPPSDQAFQKEQPHPQSQDSPLVIDPSTSLADENADFGSLSINGVNVVDASTAFQQLMPRGVNLNAREVAIVDPSDPGYRVDAGPYNWRGLLAQSLFFNIVENTTRSASDDQIRNLLAHKPFWHDYFASTKQFNMRRWNDGDDFLVNYVGHPMQGAVTSFIEIQNSPRDRQLQLGDDGYWKSRFHGFLWSLAYSTHSEIGFAGEAGVGNEGGWTYPIKCKTPGCPQWHPGWHYTNNTGWVDFTITPAVGFLWMLAEDTLDRYVSDYFQGGDRFNLGWAFLRAALNPSRSMANAMRLKAPWYRDFQHDPEVENSLIVHPLPSDEDIAEAGRFRRFAIAPYFHTMPFGSPAQHCTMCFSNFGLGFDMDYALTDWLSATFAVESQPGLLQKGNTLTGSTLSVGYGLRFVHEGRGDTISLAIRPGIVTSEIQGPLVLDPKRNMYYHPQLENERAAITLLFTNDYKLNHTVALRSSVGDTIIRYKSAIEDPPGIGKPPYLTWLSKDNYTNQSNWFAQTGPVIRF